MDSKDYIKLNEITWDKRAENNDEWSQHKGELELENSIPYADIDHLDNPYIKQITEEGGLCWGHSVEEQIQGQISAGFAIIGFYEDIGHWLFNDYINTSMATKAVKL